MRWRALICVALALAVWGTKLWLIARVANPTPFGDEWDAYAVRLFVPFRDSSLGLQHLLAPHNEHRMLTARLVALSLFVANGAWDPLLEMIVNAAMHVALGLGILLVLGRTLDRLGFATLAVVTATLLATPNAIENPFWGIETVYYAFLLFGFIAIGLLTRHTGSVVRWGGGMVAATLASLSFAPGALVFLAGAAISAAKACLGVESRGRGWAIAVALLACFAIAALLTPRIEIHQALRPATLGQFIVAFEAVAAWPFHAHMTIATLFVNAPLIILAWRSLRNAPAGDSVAWCLLGLGLWNGLQFAALAFGRAAAIAAPRYLDICTLNLIVNAACAAVLADSGRKRLLVAAWLGVMAIGWANETAREDLPEQLAARHRLGLVEEKNVRAFLATGAFPPGASAADWSIPYPNAARLAALLSDPKVRQILPSVFQDVAAGAEPSGAAPDRLRGVRDGLLRAGPWLAIAGALLMLIMIARPAWVRMRTLIHSG